MAQTTHLAYSDESQHNTGRFRGLGLVSLPASQAAPLSTQIKEVLTDSNVRELKWNKVKTAQYRFAALKVVDICVDAARAGNLRIDVLIWDTQDSRHRIRGRDDHQNMRNMYIQLFKNVLRKRWPMDATWQLFPDETSEIDWEHMRRILARTDRFSPQDAVLLGSEWRDLRQHFRIHSIEEASSATSPLVQVADLFVGMGVFSYENLDVFLAWQAQNAGQPSLFPPPPRKFSRKEQEHSTVMNHLLRRMSKKISVDGGLRTWNPTNPINFWFYQPQRATDKAPVRNSKGKIL